MKKKILFSLITLIFFFLLIEIVFRVIFFIRYDKYNTTPFIQGSSLQMGDDTTIYRNRPFYIDKNKKYQFNCEGFKSRAGDTEMPVKSAEDFWVFLFGGSAMEGMGSNKDGEWLDITGVRDYSYEKSIAFLLQQKLQLLIPGRKIKVFCAANSGFSVYQDILQYRRLKSKYKMDWIISMDGVNEPIVRDKNLSIRDYIKKDWNDYAIFKFPLKYIIPITRRSVFINSLKLALFEIKMNKRLRKAEKNNFPARSKWLAAPMHSLLYNGDSLIVRNTTDSFFYYMRLFDNELGMDGIPHLLFIQPHLSLRDTLKSSPTEKALLNYYESLGFNSPDFNLYVKRIHWVAETQRLSGTIRSLGFMHENDFETFVDYCHFSAPAISQLSDYFANCIVSGYHSQPLR